MRRKLFGFPQFLFWRCATISTKDYLFNEDIRVPQVRLIGENGEQLGIVDTDKALKAAYDSGSDLVMIADKAEPPVCRIMDYGKFRFEREKREKEARKNSRLLKLRKFSSPAI